MLHCLLLPDVWIYFSLWAPRCTAISFAVNNSAETHAAPVILVNCNALCDRGGLSQFQSLECLKVSLRSSVNGSSSLELPSDRYIKPSPLTQFHSSDGEPCHSVFLPTSCSLLDDSNPCASYSSGL